MQGAEDVNGSLNAVKADLQEKSRSLVAAEIAKGALLSIQGDVIGT